MSANKLQKERYYKLDECFRNTMHKWSLQLLLEAVNKWLTEKDKPGISKRTLQDDINFLKEVESAPIISYKEGRLNYFRYSDPSFTIKDKPISKVDEKNIRKAVNILRQLKGLSVADDLADTIQRLEQKTELDNELTSALLQFEQNTHYTGNEWFSDTYEFLLQQKVMKLSYRPFGAEEPFTVHVHPYLLKQYNQRWFLVGLCEEYKSIGTYPLDRFTDTRVSNSPFIKDTSFDAAMYDKYLLGVTIPPNAKPEKLILEFSPQRAKYFITKPFGYIEKTEILNSGNIQLTLTMIINQELEAAILQYGKDVSVISPIHLRRRIMKILKEAIDNYTDRDGD
jgi:predicted DNA-binding transcriptional regulator YafY